MTIMSTNLAEPAKIVLDRPGTQKPSAPAAPAAPAAKEEPVVKKEEHKTVIDSRYAQFKMVKMRLLKEGTIQYDPNFPELVLNTASSEGMLLPLTPFFASRINQTLELVL